MCILRSHQTTSAELTWRIIGVWDDIRRDIKPSFIGNEVSEYYHLIYDKMIEKFPSELLAAYQLTDRFLADIMSRRESAIDGIIYSSVEAKSEAVVALKPDAVNNMLEHQWIGEVLLLLYVTTTWIIFGFH